MYSVLLSGDNLMNETQLLRDCTASMTAACDSIYTDSALIQALIQVIKFIAIFFNEIAC